MDPNERAQILAMLEEGRLALLAAVAGLSDELAACMPCGTSSRLKRSRLS